jgi:hypothetical protein
LVAAFACVARSAAAQPTEPDSEQPQLGDEPHEPQAQPPPKPPPEPAPSEPAAPEAKPLIKVTPMGYIEAYYAYNFNRPSNGITNFRGFDNRHNTFSLENAALGANWESGPVGGRILLHIGSAPSTYYLTEPALGGTGSTGGANATGPELWKYIQEAYLTYRAPVGRGLTFQLGLSASPIGIEAIPIKDNWNWSHSDLFFGLPFYHTGLRATYEWTDEISTTVSVYNGWNSVVDNNPEKSVQGNVTYKLPDKLTVQALYYGGVERPAGAPEGPYWRHTFDFWGELDATSWLSFAAQGSYGWEPNRIGTARWIAGALYARAKANRYVYMAVRGDTFHEHLAADGAGRTSAPIFWNGVEWVSSLTATLDVRPHESISVRLEARHDFSSSPLFFRDAVIGDGSLDRPYVPNARMQDTIALGATAWF